MNTETIAYNIKFFRNQYDLTQLDLSEKLNISRSTVGKWESNDALPDLESLIKMSQIFDVPSDYILGSNILKKDLLKDFKRIYQSQSKPYEEEVIELIDFLMTHPELKVELRRYRELPYKKQEAVLSMFKNTIEQFNRI